MAVDLRGLLAPAHTAVLTMEMQRGVIGELATVRDLADEVAATGIVSRTAVLLGAARANGARVVHCTAQFRADRAGSAINSPMLAVVTRDPDYLLVGSDAASLAAELGPADGDVVSPRVHGLSPFGGTSLDITLRNMGVRTVVATGVSVNLGIIGLALEAVNLGYRVVVATDAVCGVPRHYAAEVMTHTLALLATRATVDEIIRSWEPV